MSNDKFFEVPRPEGILSPMRNTMQLFDENGLKQISHRFSAGEYAAFLFAVESGRNAAHQEVQSTLVEQIDEGKIFDQFPEELASDLAKPEFDAAVLGYAYGYIMQQKLAPEGGGI